MLEDGAVVLYTIYTGTPSNSAERIASHIDRLLHLELTIKMLD